MGALTALVVVLRGMLVSRTRLATENLALRQQLAIFGGSVDRPRLRKRDRVFWLSLEYFGKRAAPKQIIRADYIDIWCWS